MGLTRPRAHQLQDSDFKQSVRAIQTSNITLSGGAPSTVDGVSVSLGDRILVTGQSTASQNGIYIVTTVGSGSNGTWARSPDADTTGDMTAGMVVMVTEGTNNADTSWKITTDDPITLDTTSITFEQSSAYGYGTISVAGQDNIVADQVGDTLTVTAGNNIVLTTTAGTDTLTVAVSDSINTSGTITATGNITGGNLAVTGEISYGTLSDGTTELTSTVAELNLLDGVTGTLVTETGTQTLTNKSISGSQINSGTVPDARIQSSGVTQHQASLSITESQISDLGTYLTSPIGLGDIAGANVITSGESFSDTDNALMTAASINDRIQSFGYTTNTGDITRVNITAGTGLSGTQDTTSGDHTQTLAIDSTVATLTGSQTLTNKTLTSPQVGTDLRLNARAELEFYDTDSSHYVAFRGAATIGSNIVWTLPSSDGTADQVLATDGGGTLSWADPGSGGGSGSSFPNSTIQTLPGSDGDYDLSKTPAQGDSETPFESGVTDAFGINLGSVFDASDPIGSIQTAAEGEGGTDLGVLT